MHISLLTGYIFFSVGKSMSLKEAFFSSLIRFSFRFERFFPRFITLFLNRRLKEYKQKGALTDYRVKAKRRGKYHYNFEVDLFLNKSEVNRFLNKKGGEING